MRTTCWTSILAISLAVGACKKKQDDTGAAATEVKKTQENLDDQRKDTEKVQTDRKATANDVDKAEGNMAGAQQDVEAAKTKYAATVKDRLAKIDIRIHELEQRADAKSKDALTKIQAERASLAAKVDDLRSRAAADWEWFTKDAENAFDRIEKDLDSAMK